MIAVVGAIIFFVVKTQRSRTTIVVDENSFAQNGVRVDFSAGIITIRKHAYPVNAVTGIRYQSSGKQRTMGVQGGSVDIEVDDFKKPIHNVLFNGFSAEKDSKEFAQRLSVALRKAGGTSFI